MSQPELIKDLTKVPIPYQVAGAVYLAGMSALGQYLQDMMALAYLAYRAHESGQCGCTDHDGSEAS